MLFFKVNYGQGCVNILLVFLRSVTVFYVKLVKLWSVQYNLLRRVKNGMQKLFTATQTGKNQARIGPSVNR